MTTEIAKMSGMKTVKFLNEKTIWHIPEGQETITIYEFHGMGNGRDNSYTIISKEFIAKEHRDIENLYELYQLSKSEKYIDIVIHGKSYINMYNNIKNKKK